MNFKNFAIYLLLILATSLATWTTYLIFSADAPPKAFDSSLPDAYMVNVTEDIMAKDGSLSVKITTPLLLHYSKNDTSLLNQPLMAIYHETPNPWLINAQRALVMQGISKVKLWNKVTIRHAADAKRPETLITTEVLWLYPSERIAKTTAPITLIQPNININSIGMYADIKAGKVQLLHQSRGQYAPSP